MLGRKKPGEIYPFTYDFRELLAGGSIATIDSVTSQPKGAGANLTNEGQAEAGGLVTVYWGGGDDGESYLTAVHVSASNGGEIEIGGEILVQEKQFQIPELESAYISSDEYVARFGREETIRITDESRLGQIDAPKLQAALNDATEFAEGYLRARYDLPLESPPSLVKAIVAALARELLHKSRPTEAVTKAADRARSLLRDISLGRVVLSLEDGEAAPSASGLPVWGPAADARVFNPEKLDGFGVP